MLLLLLLLWLQQHVVVVVVAADVVAFRLLTVGITLRRKVTVAMTVRRQVRRVLKRLLFFTASICKQTSRKTSTNRFGNRFFERVQRTEPLVARLTVRFFEGFATTDANSTHEEGRERCDISRKGRRNERFRLLYCSNTLTRRTGQRSFFLGC